jgi:hypothetical protein
VEAYFMDVPLYSDEEHKDNLRESASSNNFSRVAQFTRKASKHEKTEIEISELLLKHRFSHEEVERVRSVSRISTMLSTYSLKQGGLK